MMQPELFEAISLYNTTDFPFDGVELHGLDHMFNDGESSDFLTVPSTPQKSSGICSPDQYFSSGLSEDCSYWYPISGHYLPNSEDCSTFTLEQNEFLDEVCCLSDFMKIEICPKPSEEIASYNKVLDENPSADLSLIFPGENFELDTQLSNFNLIFAYGEALENGEVNLVEAILVRLREKADPVGEASQRLTYYFVKSLDKEMDYLRHETFKIYRLALLAFYQIFPFGRFPHFLTVSEILKAAPLDREIVVVDFDIGDGLQWPSLIESLGRRKQRGVVRLISVKWDGYNCSSSCSLWRFEEIKRQLSNHARSFNLFLEVEEMRMEELAKEMKMLKTKSRGDRFVAFNCMANLPHMGRSRSSRHVFKFLEIAKDSLNKTGSTHNGIITFGDGLMVGKKKICGRFSTFLEAQWARSKAMLESMDTQFPVELTEARLAMECLFVAPYFSSLACLHRWEENRVDGSNFSTFGLESRKLCENSVNEAKELVRDGQCWVRIEEQNANELMLCYMETPLVRFTSWK